MKQIDYDHDTTVEFVDGYFGDHQITIRVIAEGHDIASQFVFYVIHQ